MDTNPVERLVGKGIGSAEYSQSASFFTSSFYLEYSDLKYKNFLIAWAYIENGVIGLLLYTASFVMTILQGVIRLRRTKSDEERILINTGIIMAITSIILIAYSTDTRIDSAYLVFFFISLIYVNRYTKNNSINQRIKNGCLK